MSMALTKLESETSLQLVQSETSDVSTELVFIQLVKTECNELKSTKINNHKYNIRDEITFCMCESNEQTQKQLQAGKLRIKVVDELFQTEKTYVQCLDNLIRHFMIPLQSKINGKLLLSPTQ
eukprot:128066_1